MHKKQHIETYKAFCNTLQKQRFVSLRNIGSLVLEEAKATFGKTGITPPRSEVLYIPGPGKTDRAAALTLAEKQQIGLDSALQKVRAFEEDVLAALHTDGQVDLAKIGVFRSAPEGHIHFTGHQEALPLPEFTGLQPIAMQPIIRKAKTVPLAENKTNNEKPVSKLKDEQPKGKTEGIPYLVAAMFLFVCMAAAVVYFNGEMATENNHTAGVVTLPSATEKTDNVKLPTGPMAAERLMQVEVPKPVLKAPIYSEALAGKLERAYTVKATDALSDADYLVVIGSLSTKEAAQAFAEKEDGAVVLASDGRFRVGIPLQPNNESQWDATWQSLQADYSGAWLIRLTREES